LPDVLGPAPLAPASPAVVVGGQITFVV
jgi:hypothetical protein